MAPLSQALAVQKAETPGLQSNESLWTGVIDLEWTIVLVPNGGYVVGLILEACIAHQKLHAPNVAEPIHVAAHFLRPIQGSVATREPGIYPSRQPASFEVLVKSVKGGHTTNNVQAEFLQNNQTMVFAHLIFGSSVPSNTGSLQQSEAKTLTPPSPYARRVPLRTLPSSSSDITLYEFWNFKQHISAKQEPAFQRLNKAENRNFITDPNSNEREPPGLEFGVWLNFEDEVAALRPSMLPFCSDIVKPLPELLPPEENPLTGKVWYATLTLSIEFKSPMRLEAHAQHSLGLYSLSRFMQEPLGRHETIAEVWTAPSAKTSDESWREKQKCLAIATQTAVCIPYGKQSKALKSRI